MQSRNGSADPSTSAEQRELERLRALRRYGILDTPPEERFDRITRLAARLLNVPVSYISFVDDRRQWSKAKYGTKLEEVDLPLSFCVHTIQSDEVLVVQDTLTDPRFRSNPLAHGKPPVRFYAGAPLCTPDGFRLGALCVVDEVPRQLSDTEAELLSELARLVVDELELSLRAAEGIHRAEQARFQALVQHGADIITLLDPRGSVLFASDSIGRIVGYEPDELVGKSIFEYIHPEDRPLALEQFDKLLRKEAEDVVIECRFARPDGTWIWLEAVASNLLHHPNVEAIVVNSRDITLRRRQEEELREAMERAEASDRLKSSVLMNLSHEFRTPLTGIIGYADILKDEATGEAQEFADAIRISGERLLDTLSNVVDLAQLDGKAMPSHARPWDVVRLIQETAAPFRALVKQKGLDFELMLPEEHFVATLSRTLLERTLQQLLGNAIKFTRSGTIRVGLLVGEEEIVVRVEDTGIGISPGFLPHVFDAFAQESSGLARTHEGTGLGLTVAGRMAELMGGSITVESAKGSGSAFSLRLPHVQPETTQETS